jgi:spore coat protein U-like protein
VLLSAVTSALVACGGGAKLGGGKQGAAKALFSASQPAGKSTSAQGLNVSGLDLRALASAAKAAGSVTVSCLKEGSLKMELDVSSGAPQTGSFSYKVSYDGCSQDGANTYDGSLTMTMTVTGTANSAELAIHMKGKIEISGDIEDFLDADVTQTTSITLTSATSGTVSVRLDGTIETSGHRYVYDNETISFIMDGKLPEDDGEA